MLLRPIRPEDFAQQREFLRHVTPEDMHSRFFQTVLELPDSELAHLTQIDYERAMAFIAEDRLDDGTRATLGVARAHTDPDNTQAEFAILVRSDLKGRGLGSVLLDKLIRYCRARGIERVSGEVLAENVRMLEFARAHGFRPHTAREGVVDITLELRTTG